MKIPDDIMETWRQAQDGFLKFQSAMKTRKMTEVEKDAQQELHARFFALFDPWRKAHPIADDMCWNYGVDGPFVELR